MVRVENLELINDRVLIKPEENLQKTNSGLYLPPGVKEKENIHGGYVLKTGPGYPTISSIEDDEPWKESSSTRYIKLQAKSGDFALYLKKDAIEIELDGEKLVIIPHSSILILKKDNLLENL